MPIPTIASKARWSRVLAGGSFVVGDLVEAGDHGVGAEADQEGVEAGDRDRPDLTPSSVQMPPMYSVWSAPVSWMHSMPANLAGWWSATSRAAVSPTKSWIGVAMQAIVSGISIPSRCRRSRRPFSIPTA